MKNIAVLLVLGVLLGLLVVAWTTSHAAPASMVSVGSRTFARSQMSPLNAPCTAGTTCPTLRIRVTPGCPYSGPTIIRCELLVSGFPAHVRVHIAYWFLMGITPDRTGNRRPGVLDRTQRPGVARLTRRPAACINNTTDSQGRLGPLPARFSFLQISEPGIGQAFEIKAHDLRGDVAQDELGHVNPGP